MERMKSEFAGTGEVPRGMSFDEWQRHREIVEPQQNLRKALAEDLEDLQARYPKSSAGFLKKLRRGEIQAPKGIENVDNAWRIGSSHLSVKPSFELWIRKHNGNCSPVKMNHGNLSAQGALILLSLRG